MNSVQPTTLIIGAIAVFLIAPHISVGFLLLVALAASIYIIVKIMRGEFNDIQ